MTQPPEPIEFLSGGLEDDVVLQVRHMSGREELSRLYHFDLVLRKSGEPLTPEQIDEMLKAPCVLSLGTGPNDLVHGILQSVELHEIVKGGAGDRATYHARLVPGAWLLTMARTNRIFQNMTVATIVETILQHYGLASGTHYSMLITGGTEHEYVVQYEESDWNFIQRWLEAEGYYYWFEQGSEGERIVFADSNDDATNIAGDVTVPYRNQNNLDAGEETIWNWKFRQQRIPARVTLVDHNYRTPHIPLVVTCKTTDLDPDNPNHYGFGTVFRYNEHFKDQTTGEAIAKARAEWYLCNRRVLHATSDCSRLRVGHKFDLDGHPTDDGTYLLVAVDHEGTGDGTSLEDEQIAYRAVFDAIPIGTQFRPDLRTEWPSIQGVIHAHIDSDGEGETAQMDDKGRYKVRLPFDSSGARGANSSRWIRKAQPYSGAGYGQHFPLHKGAEVLLAHIDGDPDRPIIVGAVPCMHTPSPSTSSNATQSVIQTHSGIRIEMEDQQG
jgi:type VI secretion system secreted protein VgrG